MDSHSHMFFFLAYVQPKVKLGDASAFYFIHFFSIQSSAHVYASVANFSTAYKEIQ